MWTRRGVLGGLAGAALAQRAWAQTLRGADLRGDVAILRDAYETLHPGLYRYATPAVMSARFDALADAWGQDQTLAEAYLSLSRFLGGVRCGHTYANFYNQSDAVQSALFGQRTRLPFQFAWIDGRMVVLASSDARLPRGTEIRAVNGLASERLLAMMMPYSRADGGNDAKRRALLEVRGFDRFETFDVFQGLLAPPWDSGFALRARLPGSSRWRTIEVEAIDLAARRAAMVVDEDENAPAWTLSFPRGDVAVLTMPTWALYNSTWDWRAFLDASFADIEARGVRRLVVDLRGNEGGLDCGHEIIARLIDAELMLEADYRRVRYRQTPARLNQYLDTWDASFRDWGDDAMPAGDGWFDLRADAGVGSIAPKGPRFRGEVLVLTDAQNSSATFQFAQIVQSNGLGRLVGAPTGGNQRGINGGAFFFLRLPASGLEADVPLIGRFPRTPKPDAGLTPDVMVALTRAAIASGRDALMDRALSL